jgi:hypothetical protein
MYLENLSISTKNEEVSIFDKRTVVELNENQMTDIDGGTATFVGTTSLLTTGLLKLV